LIRWTVYSRAGCGLCEELLVELEALLAGSEDEVAVVDVDTSPDLARRYGHRVPVLEADGEFVCAGRLDTARVRTAVEVAARDGRADPPAAP
jgi:predicted thioredoxin/glutaredoxin